MAKDAESYPVKFDVDYVAKHDRLKTFFRIFWAIPILVVLSVLTISTGETSINEAGKSVTSNSGGIMTGLFAATALMIVFRRRYPKWWFDFAVELNRFSGRIGAYLALLTDEYPSTVEQQAVHMDFDYPDVKRDLTWWMPLVKWILAVPHYFVLFFLTLFAIAATIIAWFSILFTGSYPKGLFDFVVGVGRWHLRVYAYAFLLITDEYPPFTTD